MSTVFLLYSLILDIFLSKVLNEIDQFLLQKYEGFVNSFKKRMSRVKQSVFK